MHRMYIYSHQAKGIKCEHISGNAFFLLCRLFARKKTPVLSTIIFFSIYIFPLYIFPYHNLRLFCCETWMEFIIFSAGFLVTVAYFLIFTAIDGEKDCSRNMIVSWHCCVKIFYIVKLGDMLNYFLKPMLSIFCL